MGRKIATCSYCGMRSVLVFDEGLHELVCGSCGAPLHEMKMMPQEHAAPAERKPRGGPARKLRERREAPAGVRAEWRDWPAKKQHDTYEAKRRKKKRKPLFGKVMEELWDVVEDIFD